MFAFPLRQSTAAQNVPIGPFLDPSDANTEKNSLTIANTDIKIWKAGATSLVNKNSGGATFMAAGQYYTTLDATDTNTLGPLEITTHVTGSLVTKKLCIVLPANVYDSLVANLQWLSVTTLEPVMNVASGVLHVKDKGGSVDQYTRSVGSTAGANPITSLS